MSAAPQVLRDYQSTALERLDDEIAKLAAQRAELRALLVAPTGAGKTTIAAARIERERASGGSVLFLAHRKELIDQCSKRLDGSGVRHGVVMAGHPRWMPWLPVQVASIQSLVAKNRRGVMHRAEKIKRPTLIVVDEAHRARANTYHVVFDLFPDVPVIGLTATPIRMDNRPLGDLFRALVVVETIGGLTRRGFLVPATGFAFDVPDLKGVRTTAGDYNEKDLASAVNRTAIVGNIVAKWKERSAGLRTVLFAVNVEHSKRLVEQFRTEGVAAEHLDGTTPKLEREAILERLSTGETLVVSNVGVLTEGWDEPRLECVILARPTKSLGLYLQMVGRGLRGVCRDCLGDTPWNLPACRHCGSVNVKRACRIHDHAGAVFAHDLPEAEREWSLDDDAKKRKKKGGDEENAPTVRQCGVCFALYPATVDACPACGTPAPKRVRTVEEIEDGRIVSFEDLRKKLGIGGQFTPDVAPPNVFGRPRTFVTIGTTAEKMNALREWVRVAKATGRSAGWVAGMYETEFGEKPRWRFNV